MTILQEILSAAFPSNCPKLPVLPAFWKELDAGCRRKYVEESNPGVSDDVFVFLDKLLTEFEAPLGADELKRVVLRFRLDQLFNEGIKNLQSTNSARDDAIARFIDWPVDRLDFPVHHVDESQARQLYYDLLRSTTANVAVGPEEVATEFVVHMMSRTGLGLLNFPNSLRLPGEDLSQPGAFSGDAETKLGIIKLKQGSPVFYAGVFPSSVKRAAVQACLEIGSLFQAKRISGNVSEIPCLLLFGQRNAVSVVYEVFAGLAHFDKSVLTSFTLFDNGVAKISVAEDLPFNRQRYDAICAFYSLMRWASPCFVCEKHGTLSSRSPLFGVLRLQGSNVSSVLDALHLSLDDEWSGAEWSTEKLCSRLIFGPGLVSTFRFSQKC